MRNRRLILAALGLLMCSAAHANLLGRYFSGTNIDPNGILRTEGLVERFSRVDANIDFWNGSQYYRWQPISGYGDNYTVEWTGFVKIDVAGEYGFGTISDDGSQIWINGELIVDNGEGQWYDWEDNMGENDPGEPNLPVFLGVGYHAIMVRFYEGPSYDGIELWWLAPGSGPSDIPYYGTTFHGTPPTYNPNTNWAIVPASVLFTGDEYNQTVCGMDLNSDGIVNLYEFAAMAAEWMTPGAPGAGDFTGDGSVDMEDMAALLVFWLEECQLAIP